MKKTALSLVFLVFSLCFAGAQSVPRRVVEGEEAWRYLKKAQDAFERCNYGLAVENADKAKEQQKQNVKWETYTLENLQKDRRVRHTGDLLDELLPVLRDSESRNYSDAIQIINSKIEMKGAAFYKNRLSNILKEQENYAHYPEADFLLGQIYRIEGEYKLASDFMVEALKYSEYLDVPAVKYEIMYELADLYKDTGDLDSMEKYLLLVLSENRFYTDRAFMSSLYSLVRLDTVESVNKFFLLYRVDSPYAVKALLELSQYYLSLGQTRKAVENSALASIISVTMLSNTLEQRLNGFHYSTIEDLLIKCGRYSDIVEWGEEEGVWELFYRLADCSSADGALIFSRRLLSILSQCNCSEYWRKMAQQRLL